MWNDLKYLSGSNQWVEQEPGKKEENSLYLCKQGLVDLELSLSWLAKQYPTYPAYWTKFPSRNWCWDSSHYTRVGPDPTLSCHGWGINPNWSWDLSKVTCTTPCSPLMEGWGPEPRSPYYASSMALFILTLHPPPPPRSILQPFWKGLTWLVQAHWHSRGRSYIYLPCVLNLWATLEFCLAPALGDNRSYGYRKFSAKGAQRRPIFYPLNLRQALE